MTDQPDRADEPTSSRDFETDYNYEDGDGATVARALDSIATSETEPWELATVPIRDGDTPRERARDHVIARGLSYEIREDGDDPSFATLEPLKATDGTWLTPLRSTSPASVELWDAVALATTRPTLIAHFQDIVWSARSKPDRTAALAVIDAYLAVPPADTLFYVHSLKRANSLARSLNAPDREDTARERLLAYAESSTVNTPPGLTIRALETLSVTPRHGASDPRRPRIAAALDDAWANPQRHTGDADFLTSARRRIAANSAERVAAERDHVQAYLDQAASERGFRKAWNLNQAAQLARRYELPDLHSEAVVNLQKIDVRDYEWSRSELEFKIPGWQIARPLRPYGRVKTWEAGLDVWLGTPAPTGSSSANAAAAARQPSGILGLVNRIVIGRHGLPEKSTGPDTSADSVRRLEQLTALASGATLAESLRILGSRFPDALEEDIASHLVGRHVDNEHVRTLAHALSLFLRGHYDEAGNAATPLVEAGARGLLLLLNEPLYRVEAEKTRGRFPALDFYIDALEAADLDEDWIRALKIVMTPDGFDIRNQVAHGFKHRFSPAEAALTIRLAALLILLGDPAIGRRDRAWARSHLRSPLPIGRPKWRILLVQTNV